MWRRWRISLKLSGWQSFPWRSSSLRWSFFAARWFATALLSIGTIDPRSNAVGFAGDAWLSYVPIRMPDTICVQERLPPGAAAVLINQNHTYTDLFMTIRRNRKASVRCH